MKQTLSYKKLTPFQTAQTQTKLTNQQRFWKKYQNTLYQSLNNNNVILNNNNSLNQNIQKVNENKKNQIGTISSNNNVKNLILVGQGRNIKIIDSLKKQTIRQINSFYQNVSALCMRKDGNVFAAADQSGKIQVIDVKQKFHLRKFYNHKKKINTLQYVQNDLYSAGDDFVIRNYDVAAGQLVHSYQNAHNDYIKCIKALQNNHILSGAYDGIVKLFDFRVHQAAQVQFKHQQQIQSMDLYPSKLNFIVAGGNKVSIWDIRNNKSILQGRNNKKVVTNVRLISQGSRYITTSLDNYFKVFKSDTYQMTYQQKLQSSILTFDSTLNSQCLALGLQGGKLYLKSRKPKNQDQTDQQQIQVEDQIAQWLKKNQQKTFAYNDKYFYRGIYQTSSNYDIKFQRFQPNKTTVLDNYLKKFQYKKAFLQCIQKRNMSIFLSLIDELIQRGALIRTIKSLSIQQVNQSILFFSGLIHNQKYTKVSNYVLLKILQNHQENVNLSQNVFGLVKNVDQQLDTIQNLNKLDSMLEMIEGYFPKQSFLINKNQ